MGELMGELTSEQDIDWSKVHGLRYGIVEWMDPHGRNFFSIETIYVDDKGRVITHSMGYNAAADSIEELIEDLRIMLKDIENNPNPVARTEYEPEDNQ
jgi:hypothetical protein